MTDDRWNALRAALVGAVVATAGTATGALVYDNAGECTLAQDCGQGGFCSAGGRCLSPTDGAANSAAIQAELDQLGSAGLGLVYRLPPGMDLPLGDPDGDGVALHVRTRVILEAGGARLLPPPNVTAIRMEHAGSWSTVRDLYVLYPEAEHDGIAVDVVGHGMRIHNAWLQNPGTGIRVTSNHFAEGEVVNANHQRMSDVRMYGCHHWGLDLVGSDANAGVFSGFELTGCAIRDDSFLGSLHLGHALESGPVALEQTRAANYGTWVGVYKESGPTVSTVSGRMTTLGGGLLEHVPTGDRVGLGFSRLSFRETHPNGQTVEMSIPPAAGTAAMWVRFSGAYADPLAWTLRRDPIHGDFGWTYQGTAPVELLPSNGSSPPRYRLGVEAP